MIVLGPWFGAEVTAAGLDVSLITYASDGVHTNNLPADDWGRLAAVIAAHDPVKPGLVIYANTRQWRLATAGFSVTIGGREILFATTESALGLMDGKVMRLAQPNPPAAFSWQVGPTDFVLIAADDFARAAILVSDYVQATFDALPAIFAAIAAEVIRTEADIDAAAWPPASAVLS